MADQWMGGLHTLSPPHPGVNVSTEKRLFAARVCFAKQNTASSRGFREEKRLFLWVSQNRITPFLVGFTEQNNASSRGFHKTEITRSLVGFAKHNNASFGVRGTEKRLFLWISKHNNASFGCLRNTKNTSCGLGSPNTIFFCQVPFHESN